MTNLHQMSILSWTVIKRSRFYTPQQISYLVQFGLLKQGRLNSAINSPL